MNARDNSSKQKLSLESTGGKAIEITLDDDGELVVGVDDPTADDYTDFILSAPDLLRVRDWLNRALPAPETRAERAVQEIQGVALQFGRAIVYGAPAIYPWLAEDDPAQHNCDAMGCGTHHVLARIVPDEVPAPKTGDVAP